MEELLASLEVCLREIRESVLDSWERGEGRRITGGVPGREATEDREARIDRQCEDIFLRYFGGGDTRIYTEHHPLGLGSATPSLLWEVDPFDGTDQFIHGIPEAWFSVASAFTPEGMPLAGGCVDILGGVIYLAQEGKVTKISLRSGERSLVLPRRKTLLDGESVIASYKGKWRYLYPWIQRMERFLGQEPFAGVTHYSNGGSFIYALMAAGIIDAYVMLGEPLDEILPGMAFVAASGLHLFSVQEDGTLEAFAPVPGQRGKVPFFIASSTRELAEFIRDGMSS